MCFRLWFQLSVFNGSQNLCNDFIIVSKSMTRLTLEQRKIQLWAGSSCCFQGDTGCSKRTQRSGKENRRHGNRAAPRLCFGSCGMECMGLGDGGWDIGKSPLHTSPSPKQPPQDHTERFSTTSGGFQANKLRVMQSIAFLTVTPPKKTLSTRLSCLKIFGNVRNPNVIRQ